MVTSVQYSAKTFLPSLLPPDTFLPDVYLLQQKGNPALALYKREASVLFFEHLFPMLGVGILQFARLVGRNSGGSGNPVRDWIKGHHRPSPLFQLRISMLLLLKLYGYNVANMTAIDWEQGIIYWRGGISEREHLLSDEGRGIPPEERPYQATTPQFRGERRGQATSRDPGGQLVLARETPKV